MKDTAGKDMTTKDMTSEEMAVPDRARALTPPLRNQSAKGARVLAAATAVLGAVMATRPAAVARWVSGPDDAPPPVIVRVLGGRELLQGIAVGARPSRAVLGAGILVDTSHAISMVAAAWVFPQYRRSAAVSAAVAGASAVAAALILPGRRG